MHAFSGGPAPFSVRKAYWAARGWVLVRMHWRSRPYMKWTGIRDVFVGEYLRRPPGWRYRRLRPA